MSDINADDFRTLLDRMVGNLNQDAYQPPLETCATVLREGFEENIEKAEDGEGRAWPPHAPSTVKRYGPHPLLILSEYLLESVRTEGAPSNITRLAERELAVGTNALYAATHQHGDDSRNIPQREFVYASEDAIEHCEQLIADYTGQILGA